MTKRPYELVVRGTTVELGPSGGASGFIHSMGREVAIRRLLPEMKAWCEMHGGTYELRHKFIFDNEQQVMIFLMRWS